MKPAPSADVLPLVKKSFYATGSTRRSDSRGREKYRLVPSIDRYDLKASAWEVLTISDSIYYTCHPARNGERFCDARRFYPKPRLPLPKHVRKANIQAGNRVRFWLPFQVKRMKGDLKMKVELLPNNDLRMYYPPGLSAEVMPFVGGGVTDRILHAKGKEAPRLVKEIIRETTKIYD